MRFIIRCFILLLVADSAFSAVRLKDLTRVQNNRDQVLTGYGIVVGLSGTGDSARNVATLQSLRNALLEFGLQVDESDLSTRNAAAVIVTARMGPFMEKGDTLDVTVSSTGDARSLTGGTLLLTPLYDPEAKLYALAQGPLTTGGYRVQSFDSTVRKNHTTVAAVAGGAIIERESPFRHIDQSKVSLVLNQPDFTTADRIATRIESRFSAAGVELKHPGRIDITIPEGVRAMSFIAALESLTVEPDVEARVVVNERTGTIVAGADVTIDSISIAHGDLKIDIDTKYRTSQPQFVATRSDGIQSLVTPETEITVEEESTEAVSLPDGTSVAQLVSALKAIKLSTRDIISVLQSVKAAGALHAELIIQ